MDFFDYIIVGTGQATGTLLGKWIPEGKKIAVVEGGKVGGSCVNYGCTPTKTLVASAKAIHKARQGEEYGFKTGNIEVNYERVRKRMNKVRNDSRTGLRDWIESADNVTFYNDFARFTSSKTLKVGSRDIEGDRIFINVGTRSREPEIQGLQEVPWMGPAELLDLEKLPEHLLIVGGGYVGVELAQVYRRFGSEVTIIQRNEQLLPGEDKDVADSVKHLLQKEGIKVYCEAETKSVYMKDSHLSLTMENTEGVQNLSGSHLLIAAGRIPNNDTLQPEAAGIQTDDRGYISVDDKCRTSAENVFALGDVNGEGAFTHTAVNDAEIVLDHLNGGDRKISDRNTIYSLFTDPPLGRVGLTEKEALDQGYEVLKATRDMSKISRAKEMGETHGFAKLLVDGDTDQILGASVFGPGGDEIISMFATIMHSGIPCHEYRNVVLVHPTVSELMPFILDDIKKAREES